MMPRKLLITSLCLNVGLGIAWGVLSRGNTERREVVPAPERVASTQVSPPPATNAVLAGTARTNVAKFTFDWARLESEDYKQYIANLRAVGCPELTIHDIILAELDNLYEPKLNALKGLNIPMPDKFWLRSQPSRPKRDQAADKEIVRLETERRELVKELLGLSERSWRTAHNYFDDGGQSRYAFLSPEKQELLQKYEYRYEKLGGALRKGTGYQNEEARQKMLVDLKTFMTPEEILEYELRTSNLARQTRNSLRNADVSEQEFRSIFTAAYEARNLAAATNAEEKPTPEQIMAARMRANEAVKTVLGEERYAEMQRARDYGYRQMVAAAPYLGYDKAAAVRVAGMKQDAERASLEILNNPALSPEQKGKALFDIRQVSEKAVKAQLGERGFNYYRKSGGSWLNNPGPYRPTTPAP